MRNTTEAGHGDEAWADRLGASIRELPTERQASRMLEERTVSALRERNLLFTKSRGRIPRGWIAGAAAASIAFFATGVAVGQWLGTRTTATALATAQGDVLLNALQVQHAGTAYVNALQALAIASDSTDPQIRQQGREVALAAFHAAASEVARLAPNDPVAAEILRGLQHTRELAQPARRNTDRKVIWY